MNDMQAAFVKAGMVKQEDIDHQEELERQEEEKKQARKRKEEERKHQARRAEEDRRNAALKPFNDLYFGKGRGFLNHLVHSFLAIDKENGVDTPFGWEGWNVKQHRCALCSVEVISILEAVDIHTKAFGAACDKAAFRRKLDVNRERLEKLGVGTIDEDKIEVEFNQFMEDMKGEFGGKKLAVCSRKSTAILCHPCYKALYDWILFRLLEQDRSIQRIIAEHNDNPLAKYFLNRGRRRKR